MKNLLLIIIASLTLLLSACGVSNNLQVSTTAGNCSSFNLNESSTTESNTSTTSYIPAPYCMAVTVTNNGGGQNYINSTTAPISNLTITVNGATNITTPTNSSLMDPSNCSGSTLNPGSACTFYLQISQEAYPVNSIESVDVTLNYTVNSNLFGGGGSNNSTSFNIYETTNLYITKNNGWLSIINGSTTPLTNIWAESADIVNSTAIDNSSLGYLYFAGNQGIYQYGQESTTKSISPNAFSGASNILSSGGNMYTAATNSTGIYQWQISNFAWGNNGAAVFPYNSKNALINNANTISSSNIIYLANNTQVIACGNFSGSNSCNQEGVAAVLPTITSLGFMSAATNNSGLYVGTTNGLFVESSPISTNTSGWNILANQATSGAINSQINTMTTDGYGNLYAGDNNGYIWLVTQTSQTNKEAVEFCNIANDKISSMTVDTAGNVLYFVTAANKLYGCEIGQSTTSCTPQLITTLSTSGSAIGMNIGSALSTSM